MGSMARMQSSNLRSTRLIADLTSSMRLTWVSGTVLGRFSEPEVKRIAAVSGTSALRNEAQEIFDNRR